MTIINFDGEKKIVSRGEYRKRQLLQIDANTPMNKDDQNSAVKLRAQLSRLFRYVIPTREESLERAQKRMTLLARFMDLSFAISVSPHPFTEMSSIVKDLSHSALAKIGIKTNTYKAQQRHIASMERDRKELQDFTNKLESLVGKTVLLRIIDPGSKGKEVMVLAHTSGLEKDNIFRQVKLQFDMYRSSNPFSAISQWLRRESGQLALTFPRDESEFAFIPSVDHSFMDYSTLNRTYIESGHGSIKECTVIESIRDLREAEIKQQMEKYEKLARKRKGVETDTENTKIFEGDLLTVDSRLGIPSHEDPKKEILILQREYRKETHITRDCEGLVNRERADELKKRMLKKSEEYITEHPNDPAILKILGWSYRPRIDSDKEKQIGQNIPGLEKAQRTLLKAYKNDPDNRCRVLPKLCQISKELYNATQLGQDKDNAVAFYLKWIEHIRKVSSSEDPMDREANSKEEGNIYFIANILYEDLEAINLGEYIALLEESIIHYSHHPQAVDRYQEILRNAGFNNQEISAKFEILQGKCGKGSLSLQREIDSLLRNW